MQKPIVLRLSYSAYQDSDYPKREADRIRELGLEYQSIDLYKRNASDRLILISNSNVDFTKIAPELLEQAAFLIHPNSGFDNLFQAKDLINFPCIGGNLLRRDSVTEYTLSCLFEYYHSFSNHKEWDKNRYWPRDLISEKNIQIIGHGHIGSKLEAILKSIGATTFIYDPKKNLNELNLAKADIILFVPSLTESSHHFLNLESIKLLKENVLLINPSRGKVIEEKALVTFLKSNPNSYCYLDVFENEPHNFDCFKNIKNIKLSSHIAGVYNNLDNNMIDFIEAQISSYLESPETFAEKNESVIDLKDN